MIGYVYSAGIPNRVLRPDDNAVREIEDALRIAERYGDDLALGFARIMLPTCRSSPVTHFRGGATHTGLGQRWQAGHQ